MKLRLPTLPRWPLYFFQRVLWIIALGTLSGIALQIAMVLAKGDETDSWLQLLLTAAKTGALVAFFIAPVVALLLTVRAIGRTERDDR